MRSEWMQPLVRGLIGLVVLAVLVLAARKQFGEEPNENEPFDAGVD